MTDLPAPPPEKIDFHQTPRKTKKRYPFVVGTFLLVALAALGVLFTQPSTTSRPYPDRTSTNPVVTASPTQAEMDEAAGTIAVVLAEGNTGAASSAYAGLTQRFPDCAFGHAGGVYTTRKLARAAVKASEQRYVVEAPLGLPIFGEGAAVGHEIEGYVVIVLAASCPE